jgi:hypothetical protein
LSQSGDFVRQTTIARWQLEYDAEATAGCYAQLPLGCGCDCPDCRNYLTGVESFFPPEFRRIADDLGIDLAKPDDLMHCGRDPSTGLHITGGWFGLVGRIVSGADVVQWSGSTGTYHFERLDPPFEFGFGSKVNLIREPFRPHGLIQLEFLTQVPWVLGEPEEP